MYMKLFILALTGFILAACATPGAHDDILRETVYEVTERDCRGEKEVLQSCETITLVELVKGNFYGIPSDKWAFVLWSGEKDDLTYVARKLGDVDKDDGEPGVVIFREEGYAELLNRSKDGSVVYSFGEEGNFSSVHLRELLADEFRKYSREYPGND